MHIAQYTAHIRKIDITEYKQSGNCRFLPLMIEKSALAGEGGGARPPPYTLVTITYKVAVYAPAERADALPVSHIYPYMYSVVDIKKGDSKRGKGWLRRMRIDRYPSSWPFVS